MSRDDGTESEMEVQQGAIVALRLPAGQTGTLRLTPLHRFDVGMGGFGRGGTVKVVGGALGILIDARGRPLRMPSDPVQRRELLSKWLVAAAMGQH